MQTQIRGSIVIAESAWPKLVVRVEHDARPGLNQFLKPYLGKFEDADIKRNAGIVPDVLTITLAEQVEHTREQERLYWGMVGLLCRAYRQENGQGVSKRGADEGLRRVYAERESTIDPVGGFERERILHVSEMNREQLSRLMEGAIIECSMYHMVLNQGSDYHRLVAEWYLWRGKLKRDTLEESYANVDNYRARHPKCEACWSEDSQHIAHIGGGGVALKGPVESWAILALCARHHTGLQHQAGWIALLRVYKHLRPKVEKARERLGLGSLETRLVDGRV